MLPEPSIKRYLLVELSKQSNFNKLTLLRTSLFGTTTCSTKSNGGNDASLSTCHKCSNAVELVYCRWSCNHNISLQFTQSLHSLQQIPQPFRSSCKSAFSECLCTNISLVLFWCRLRCNSRRTKSHNFTYGYSSAYRVKNKVGMALSSLKGPYRFQASWPSSPQQA